jgi:hypothetical protein
VTATTLAVPAMDERMAAEIIERVIASRRERLDLLAGWRGRVREIDLLNAGKWSQVFPQDIREPDYPMVANLFRVSIEDGGRLFAEQRPQERVYPAGIKDSDLLRAERRERVINGYTYGSDLFDQQESFGQDLIAAGLTGIKVWPAWDQNPAKRLPRFHHVDARIILPEPRWSADRPSDNVILTYRDTASSLLAEYPAAVGEMFAAIAEYNDSVKVPRGVDLTEARSYIAGTPSEFEVIEWYSSSYVCKVALWTAPNDPGTNVARLLTAVPNPTGMCPVQLAARRSWATEPMGQLDDAKGIVRTENRYFRLLLDYFVQMVYGGKVAWNIHNPRDKGPGVVYIALSPDAKMEPVVPEVAGFDATQIIGILEDGARTTMVAPRSREGDVQLNKATAAFLSGAQGQLRSVIASNQREFSAAKRRANEVAQAMDEAWLDTEKTITGKARGRRFSITYRPSVDIAGDYSNEVSFGAATGLDLPTHNVIQLEKLGAGGLALKDFLEQDPNTDDVDAALRNIRLGKMEQGLLEAFPTWPPEIQLRALKLMQDEQNASVASVAEELIGAMQDFAARQQPASPLAGAPAPAGPPGVPVGVLSGRPVGPREPPGVAAVAGTALPPAATLVGRRGRR